MAKVSVNLVTWNGSKYILDCLKYLFNQSFRDFSLLIIDNGSTDDTLSLIKEKYPHLKIVTHSDNQGFAKAHNQAIHWTKSDYVLTLNQDIVLEPDFLERLVDFMENHPESGSVTGKLRRWQANQKTKYIDSIGFQIYKNHRVVDLGSGELDEGQYDDVSEIFGVSGAAPLYRRSALEEVMENSQFFDEDFFSYKEDVDLAYRLQWQGWKSYKVPQAVAYHDRSVSGPVNQMSKGQIAKNRRLKSKFANYHSYRNHLYMLTKNAPRLTGRIFFYELIKILYISFAEPGTLKAFGEYWRNRKRFLEKRRVIMAGKKVEFTEVQKWLV
ncbi:MAG: glycosyltransferase family 2 protein [Patescibacteria group bacterium]